MKQLVPRRFLIVAAVAVAGVLALVPSLVAQMSSGRTYGAGPAWWNAGWGGVLPWDENYDNAEGQVTIKNVSGAVRTKDHAFFEPLGTNGRACVTCHQPASAMSVSAGSIRERWRETEGHDPIFAAFDGSNCPSLPQSEIGSHSLAIESGLFRIPLQWPPKGVAHPEFRIEVVRDPAGCNATAGTISVYRRPRMVANFNSLAKGPTGSVVFMADGREPSLESQASSAALGHEQAHAAPTEAQLRQIVEFENQIFTAQNSDIRGGLVGRDTRLGVESLARGEAAKLMLVGGASFDPWRKPLTERSDWGVQREFRASVARGSDIFFGRTFAIGKVAGAPASNGSCATCHASGTTRWMDIGTANQHSDPRLPLFKITCEANADPHPYLGRVIFTQDPGRALISGKCADVGSIVLQQFRGLSARAPYFANGSAGDLRAVVDYYERRFGIGYSEREKTDLINFLKVL